MKTTQLVTLSAVFWLSVGCGVPTQKPSVQSATSTITPPTSASPVEARGNELIEFPDEEALFALGKEKYLEGCAGCHNERGDQIFPDGRRLCDLEFTESALREKVEKRSRTYPPEVRVALVVYIKSILLTPVREDPPAEAEPQ